MTDYLLPNPQPQESPSLKFKEDSFESESTSSSADLSTVQNSLENLNNNNGLPKNIMKDESSTLAPQKVAEKVAYQIHSVWKYSIVAIGLYLLFQGRYNIPNNDVDNLVDNVLDYFTPINNWIHANKESYGPKLMLFLCATNMDVVFFATLIHWFKYGKTGRIIYALCIFYVSRTLVQFMSFQPFPKGYYWDSPGFPSFVAPYGRTTDFFFSGHTGFLVLMQNEWGKLGHKKVQRFIQIMIGYTTFVLLACQAHYSIDIFTGIFFADYVFGKADAWKDPIDQFIKDSAEFSEKLLVKIFGRKTDKKEE